MSGLGSLLFFVLSVFTAVMLQDIEIPRRPAISNFTRRRESKLTVLKVNRKFLSTPQGNDAMQYGNTYLPRSV